jgi:hypothetical protein
LEKLVPKGARVKAIVALRPWFVSGRFGVNMTIQQILVPKMSSGKPTTYAFSNKTGVASIKITASESIKAIEKAKEEEPEDEQDEEQKADTDVESVEDSDVVEAQEEDEEEEEPQPQKVARKPSSAPVAAVATAKSAAAKPRAVPARK